MSPLEPLKEELERCSHLSLNALCIYKYTLGSFFFLKFGPYPYGVEKGVLDLVGTVNPPIHCNGIIKNWQQCKISISTKN